VYSIEGRDCNAPVHKTTYGPLIDTALFVMLLIRQAEGGWTLVIEPFLSPVKWRRAVR
jgi:hypothetical protein